MGWKGLLRSVGAASRRAERAKQSRSRAVDRALDKVDRVEDRLDAELARDRAKVVAFEAKVRQSPVFNGGLCFEAGRWSLKSLSDQTGSMRWTLDVSFGSDDASWSGDLELPNLRLRPKGICVTTYGVFVAFESIVEGSATKLPKLLYRADRRRNRLLLQHGTSEAIALEGTIDTPDARRLGLVAFPSVEALPQTFSIVAVLPSGRASIDVRLKEAQTGVADADSLVSRFDAQVNQALESTRDNLKKTRGKIAAQRGSGCVVVVLYGAGVLTGLCYLLLL